MSGKDIDRSMTMLYGPFATRVAVGLADAHKAGIDAYVFEAWRSPERQAELFAAGRTKPGPRVTNARPWESWHQYGLAVDLAFGGPGRWHWEGDWAALRTIMERCGLRSLAPLEQAHVEWPSTIKVAAAHQLERAGGLLSVWQRVEKMYKVS